MSVNNVSRSGTSVRSRYVAVNVLAAMNVKTVPSPASLFILYLEFNKRLKHSLFHYQEKEPESRKLIWWKMYLVLTLETPSVNVT